MDLVICRYACKMITVNYDSCEKIDEHCFTIEIKVTSDNGDYYFNDVS